MKSIRACPRCGRYPQLRQEVLNSVDGKQRLELRYECRRWWGLKQCFAVAKPNWVDKDWVDLGVEVAIERWNASVAAFGKALGL